jgi:prepilin-type processing-associated H-X9-DG protein
MAGTTKRDRNQAAFTRTECVVVIGMLILLGLLHVAAGPSARNQSQMAMCQENLRALVRAWTLYAHANSDELVGAASWNLNSRDIPNWSAGSWLTLNNATDLNNWGHEQFTKRSPLWSYVPNTNSWRCPVDPSVALNRDRKPVPRIRSYSMNNWVGGPGWDASGAWWPRTGALSVKSRAWQVFRKITDFSSPGSSRTFVFLDERCDSINDGFFTVDMAGFPQETFKIVDFPASWHNRGANLAFADGHVELWHWSDARTMPPLSVVADRPLNVNSANNPDVRRLQQAATRRFP